MLLLLVAADGCWWLLVAAGGCWWLLGLLVLLLLQLLLLLLLFLLLYCSCICCCCFWWWWCWCWRLLMLLLLLLPCHEPVSKARNQQPDIFFRNPLETAKHHLISCRKWREIIRNNKLPGARNVPSEILLESYSLTSVVWLLLFSAAAAGGCWACCSYCSCC